jgi:hypothetical protein
VTPDQEPQAIARSIIDSNRYMVLGTADPDGRPRVSPVYYAPDGYSDIYWISSPAAHHSQNIARRPDVSLVVFDSTRSIGTGQAVYMIADAEEIPEDELDRCAEVACRPRFPEQRPFPAEKLRPPGQLCLYRARVIEHSIHVGGSDPVRGRGVDYRLAVALE